MKANITQNALLETLSARYATKQFDPTRQISDSDWNALAESLRLSPSSYGLQPWKFILVKNPAVRSELRKVSWNQSQVEEASHFVVFTTLKQIGTDHVEKYMESTAKLRGLEVEALKGFQDMILGALANNPNHQPWNQRQAYIAMGFLGLSAALLGIDSVMMEGLDGKAYDQILGLENGPYATVAAVALGYRSDEDKTAHYAKSRFELDDVVQVI